MTYFLRIFLTALTLVGALELGASVSKHSNSLGTVSYETNPYRYEVGTVTTGWSIDNDKGLVLRVQPMGTYNLFTEDILFCGNPLDMLENKSNPMVLTYRIRSNRTIRGIGCHDLIRVDEVKDENGLLPKTR